MKVGLLQIMKKAILIGDDTDSTVEVVAQNADANKPKFRYNKDTNAWEFSNNGSDFVTFGSSNESRWTAIGASKYTATPASTSQITMSDTSDCSAGRAIRYKYNGSTYYGRIKTVTTDTSIDIQGAPLDTGHDLTELAIGAQCMSSQSSYCVSTAYGDGTTATLLFTDMKTKEKWLLPKAHLVYFEAMHETVATVTQPKINVLVNAQRVSTNDSNNGVQLSTSGAFVGNSDVAINTSYYDINPGEALELEVTAAGDSTASAKYLSVFCYWVFE